MDMHLIGVYIMDVHLMARNLMGVHFMSVHHRMLWRMIKTWTEPDAEADISCCAQQTGVHWRTWPCL